MSILVVTMVVGLAVVIGAGIAGYLAMAQAHRQARLDDRSVERLIARRRRVAHAGRRSLAKGRHARRVGTRRRVVRIRHPEHAA